MTVQNGPNGYDPSLTISEQIVKVQATLTAALANGREGTPGVQALRQRIADLQAQQANHQAAQAAAKAALAAHAATNPKGVTVAAYPHKDVNE